MESFKTRDLHGPENSIPLSPQWLLPKPGENKSAAATGDPPINCSPTHVNRTDFIAKVSGNGDETIDTEKRKDVWRSALVEAERRENWRDEERENTNIRRDRWREGDKDLGDHRRSDRWAENAMGRSPGEIRRLPSDRWNDTGNREPSYDARRESKWDTRWGRDNRARCLLRSIRRSTCSERHKGELMLHVIVYLFLDFQLLKLIFQCIKSVTVKIILRLKVIMTINTRFSGT
jgi:hypothetical protein